MFCPRCTARLAAAHDPSLPADLQLCRCMKCDGIWLNRGELSRFKAHQQRKRQKNPDAAAAAVLTRFIGDPKSWKVTGTHGMFAYPQGEEEEDPQTVAETVKRAAPLIAQTLARLLLGL